MVDECGPVGGLFMIYPTQARADEVANMLNERRGFPRAKAVLTEHGWTVIASYEYGVT